MKYAVITFGCRVNQADSLRVEEDLRALGVRDAAPENADFVVVNTCSVTATADQGARQAIRRVARGNPRAKIVVTGCYATRCPHEVLGLPSVVRVVPNDDKNRLVATIASDIGLTTTQRHVTDGEQHCGKALEPGVTGRTAYTLCVQKGCDEPCAYCIIPSTRGRTRSLPVEAVLSGIDRAVAAGFKEIALTGVHLGAYGRDLSQKTTLAGLLRRVARRTDRTLFRISSLEPMDCTREIIDLVACKRCFAPHFHLPLQHASDAMLCAMRRPYTLDTYDRLVNEVRARIPHASIGSDLIVGFPGERDEDFEMLRSYVAMSPLTYLHVFPYSDRAGTAAEASPAAKIPGDLVRERAREVRAIGRRLDERFRKSQVGTVRRGLTLEDGSLVVTDNHLKVRIPHGRVRNEWLNVKITGEGETMTGEVVGP